MLYKRLADLRNDHDKTQAQLAEYLHCNPLVYGRYERGVREIPAWMVVELAKYYEVSSDYIFGLTDEPRPYPRKTHT